MQEAADARILSPGLVPGRKRMLVPEDVATIVRLSELGWGTRRIATELGVSRTTVKRWLREQRWKPYDGSKREAQLAGLEDWLQAEFAKHRGNAAVVHQELRRQHGIEVGLRTVQRALAGERQRLRAEAKATVRFETAPGRQLQADFGEMRVEVAGEPVRVHLGVVTLGYSRRTFVRAFPCQRQTQWLEMFEEAFRHFGGRPHELLIDNARALVSEHDVRSGQVTLNPTFEAFCTYWGVKARACAPYRARTKGKDERMVQYVKRNALAGHAFETWADLDAHLEWWMREIADTRVHGTTGERPIDRFERTEAAALQALVARPAFQSFRELTRRVHQDCVVEVDTNQYSVPYGHIGQTVRVQVFGGRLKVFAGESLIADHAELRGHRLRSIEPKHLEGVVALHPSRRRDAEEVAHDDGPLTSELQRPLEIYEQLTGGAW